MKTDALPSPLAMLIARRRREDADRSEADGVRRSLDFFERQRERAPAALRRHPLESRLAAAARALSMPAPPTDDELVSQLRDGLLRDAETFVRCVVDPAAGHAFHAVDAELAAIPIGTSLAQFVPDLFPLLRDKLPVTARPGPVAVFGTRAIIRLAVAAATGEEIGAVASVAIRTVAAHEAAHAADASASGIRLPPGATLAEIRSGRTGPDPDVQRRQHGPRWARLVCHAFARTRPLFGEDAAWRLLDGELRPWCDPFAVRAVIARELDYVPADHPLERIARLPIPGRLKALFTEEGP